MCLLKCGEQMMVLEMLTVLGTSVYFFELLALVRSDGSVSHYHVHSDGVVRYIE